MLILATALLRTFGRQDNQILSPCTGTRRACRAWRRRLAVIRSARESATGSVDVDLCGAADSSVRGGEVKSGRLDDRAARGRRTLVISRIVGAWRGRYRAADCPARQKRRGTTLRGDRRR